MSIEYAKALVDWLEKNLEWPSSVHDENIDDLSAALAAVPKPVEENSAEVEIFVGLTAENGSVCADVSVLNSGHKRCDCEDAAFNKNDTHRAIIVASIPPVKAVPVVEGTTLNAAKEVL